MAMDPNQALAPQDYATQQAEKSRREMAMALMNGQVQNRQPTHPLQALGNIANTALGASQLNKANEMGRASDLHDASTFKNNIWGGQRPGVPFAPPAPMTGGGPGMPPGMGGVQPGSSPSPPMPPPMPPPPPQQMAGGPPGPPPGMPGQMSGQPVPNLGIGGFPPGSGGVGWPEMPQQGQSPWGSALGFNPQG